MVGRILMFMLSFGALFLQGVIWSSFNCNLLRPLINIVLLLVPYGYIIKNGFLRR